MTLVIQIASIASNIIAKINEFNYKIIDEKYYMFSLNEKNQNINIFFDKVNLDLIGWQTEDLYQNINTPLGAFYSPNLWILFQEIRTIKRDKMLTL